MVGSKFTTGFGGKGANQAVMAARLGGVGEDSFGQDTIENYKKNNVDTQFVTKTDKASTGVAPIFVTPDGSNSIIVVPGANNCLTAEDIHDARSVFVKGSTLVTQFEVPMATIVAALKLARENEMYCIVNPAPACDDIPDDVFRLSDIFCPNEVEAGQITGMSIKSPSDAFSAADMIRKRGAKTVLITLGSQGFVIVSDTTREHVAAEKVPAVVDTAGAGDCFIGSFAYYRLQYDTMESLKRASKAASLSVQKEGTQTSYPYPKDLSN